MVFKQLFGKSPLSLSIVPEGSEAAREDNKFDYLPFGVKTLKVAVAGDYRGKLHLSPARLSPVAGEKFAHEDGDGPPQFVVSWGGGHEDYYELDYPKRRMVHFLVHHVGQAFDDRPLTIQIRPEGSHDILAQLTVILTYPTIQDDPWPSEELVRPTWQEVTPGPAGESDIVLAGRYAPDYISRWWPRNWVIYDAYGAPPPLIRVRYRRLATGDSGDLAVYATGAPGGHEVLLATIQGRLPYPLYDMQQVVPELFRFGPQTWALRVWFFWLDKEISLEDLSRYGTRTAGEIQHAWQGLRSKAEGGLADQSWQEAHEIPDAERVDIVFDQKFQTLFAATDLHWREMWGRHEQPDTPVVVQIMNTRPAALAQDWQELYKVVDGWGKVILSQLLPRNRMSPPYNPQLEVVRELTGQGQLAADPLVMDSHTPAIMNVVAQVRFTSTDVTEG
jgi:hypothetical protein